MHPCNRLQLIVLRVLFFCTTLNTLQSEEVLQPVDTRFAYWSGIWSHLMEPDTTPTGRDLAAIFVSESFVGYSLIRVKETKEGEVYLVSSTSDKPSGVVSFRSKAFPKQLGQRLHKLWFTLLLETRYPAKESDYQTDGTRIVVGTKPSDRPYYMMGTKVFPPESRLIDLLHLSKELQRLAGSTVSEERDIVKHIQDRLTSIEALLVKSNQTVETEATNSKR